MSENKKKSENSDNSGSFFSRMERKGIDPTPSTDQEYLESDPFVSKEDKRSICPQKISDPFVHRRTGEANGVEGGVVKFFHRVEALKEIP